MRPRTIRRATSADAPALVRMACRFIAESSYRGLVTPDPSHQEKVIGHLLEHGAIFVATLGDEVVGMIALALVPSFVSGDLTVVEIAWWLEPEYRQGGAGLRLLAAAEGWAADVGAAWMQMIAPAGNEGLAAIYTRRGYARLETTFQRKVTTKIAA